NKVRTFFAILGILFGVVSLILIVAAIEGSNLQANRVIKKLGPDSVLIVSGAIGKGPKGRLRNLSLKDVREISKLEGIFALTYGIVKPTTVSSLSSSKFSAVFGVGENWLSSWNYKIEQGRGFTLKDFRDLKKVAVIGHDVSDFFWPGENPIGKVILIGKTPFRVIGVYKKKGKTPNGHNLDNRVFIPYRVYDKTVEKTHDKVSIIRFRVLDASNYSTIVEEVRAILLKNHSPNDFTLITPVVVKKFLSMLSATFALFLGIASTTALIVGGFVLSAIFYVNVYTRQWEIGLRKALGATRKKVVIRILSESLVVAVSSAITGSILGILLIPSILKSLNVPVVYPVKAFIIATIFSVAVCLFAAYFPAKRASEFNPVESLRRKIQ
ncbi:MAG: ABC transporter permease, partial [Desulfurobacteriaceae bacterium]